MNLLRDNKQDYFRSLTRGERLYMMMKHAYEIQCSPLFRHMSDKSASAQRRQFPAEIDECNTANISTVDVLYNYLEASDKCVSPEDQKIVDEEYTQLYYQVRQKEMNEPDAMR